MTGWMQRPFVALGMLAMAMGMIPLNDALIKLMSAYMPLAEIALIRGVLSMIVLAIFTGGVSSKRLTRAMQITKGTNVLYQDVLRRLIKQSGVSRVRFSQYGIREGLLVDWVRQERFSAPVNDRQFALNLDEPPASL